MSDNNIEPQPDQTAEAGGEAAPDQPQPCPTCGQLPDGGNSEAAARRHQVKARDVLIGALQESNAALERQVIEDRIRGVVAPTAVDDFLAKTDLGEMRTEDGGVDYAAFDQHVTATLVDNPHMRAPDPNMPLVAPAPTSGDPTGIGFRPTSVLNVTEAATEQPTWGDVFTAGAKGGG